MDYNNPGNNGTKVAENVEGIKKDMKNLMGRLKGMGNESVEMLSDEFNNLTSHMKDLGYKGKQMSESGLEYFCSSTREHPGRNLALAFLGGAVFAMLMKK